MWLPVTRLFRLNETPIPFPFLKLPAYTSQSDSRMKIAIR